MFGCGRRVRGRRLRLVVSTRGNGVDAEEHDGRPQLTEQREELDTHGRAETLQLARISHTHGVGRDRVLRRLLHTCETGSVPVAWLSRAAPQ